MEDDSMHNTWVMGHYLHHMDTCQERVAQYAATKSKSRTTNA